MAFPVYVMKVVMSCVGYSLPLFFKRVLSAEGCVLLCWPKTKQIRNTVIRMIDIIADIDPSPLLRFSMGRLSNVPASAFSLIAALLSYLGSACRKMPPDLPNVQGFTK
jgi:hypothetical protein